jgi:cysteinyl-tRNA synthetase
MPLTVYNTLSRSKEKFTPHAPPRVGMYVCGPTVYGHAHLGHAKSYVSFDVVLRYLRHLDYDVTYVQNITDVGHLTEQDYGMADEGEDKIIREAKQRGVHPMAVAEFFTNSYFADMDALSVLRPDIAPRATGHIPEQIELVERLIATGHAYEVEGNVYFNTASFADYGKLSGRRLEEAESGTRVAERSDKRSPSDFALWKRAEPEHIMQWPSPWGRGYPGWHLECSVMSTKYLGQPFDIHGGGLENQFPHHECEIAQCEAGTGTPFVKYWLHNNMITINGTKMGKSLNNFVSLKEIFSGKIADPERAKNVSLSRAYPPDVVRFLILQSHYRAPADFSDEALEAALKGHTRLRECVQSVRGATASARDGEVEPRISEAVEQARAKFTEAMDDDFNTAGALSALFDLVRTANTAVTDGATRGSLDAINDVFTTLGGTVLGVIREHYDAQAGGANDLLSGAMELLIQLRADARKNKDFATSDKIRDALAAKGLALEDRPDVTVWRPAGP